MVIAASKRDTLVIEKSDLEIAEKVLQGAEISMMRVFEHVGVIDEQRHINEITALVQGYGWITIPNLYKLCYNIMADREFKAAVRTAREAGILTLEQRGNEYGLVPKRQTIH